MTARATPPFRADHVGSLLRPPALLAARDEFAAGKIGAAALAAVEDAAIRDAVKLQEDAGLRSATDGEYLRSCGAAVDEIRLGDLGIHGNGHAMMLEQNNAEVAAVITDWIVKHT